VVALAAVCLPTTTIKLAFQRTGSDTGDTLAGRLSERSLWSRARSFDTAPCHFNLYHVFHNLDTMG